MGRRMVVFDPAVDAEQHRGRAAVRQAVLTMTPDPSGDDATALVVPTSAQGPVFWGVLAANDLPLVLRVGGFRTAREAQRDAATLLARAEEMQACSVSSRRPNLTSAWLTLDGRVVLVGGQFWRPGTMQAELAVLRAVRQRALWEPGRR